MKLKGLSREEMDQSDTGEERDGQDDPQRV